MGMWKRVPGPRSVFTAATGGGNTAPVNAHCRGLPLFSPGEKVPPKCLMLHVFLGCLTKSFFLHPTHLKIYIYF